MKSAAFLCLLLFIGFPTLSQDLNKIDSLMLLVSRAEDEEKIQLLNDIAWEYRLSYPDSSVIYARKAIDLGQSKGIMQGIAQSLNYMGIASVYQGRYTDAFSFHQQALEHAELYNDSTQIAHAYNSLGRLFFSQGDQIKSYNYYHQALEIFERLKDQQGAAYCYKSLAQLYTLQNENTKALEMLHKTLRIRQESDDKRGMISVYKDLALIAQKDGDYAAALTFLEKAKDISTETSDQISVAEIDLSLGALYLEQQEYQKALVNSLAALTRAQSSDNQHLLVDINLLLGKIFLYKQNYQAASQHLEKVIQYAREGNLLTSLTDAHCYLSKLHQELRSYEKALFHHQQFINFKDSLFNAEKAKNIERMETRLLLSNKEYEYNLLKATAAQQQVSLVHEQNKNITQTIIIVLSLVLVVVMIVFYTKSKKRNRELEDHKLKIESQNREISLQHTKIKEQYLLLEEQNDKLKVLNQEKDTLMNIVAHDLKSPFNRLSGLSELLMLPGQGQEDREKYVSLIKETSQEGVNLVKDFLDINAFTTTTGLKYTDVRLSSFLEKEVADFQAEAAGKNLKIHIQCSPQIHFRADISYLSRILDNLLSNAIKYSYANTNVYIMGGMVGEGQVMISIRDEGPGFSEEDKKHLYKKFRKLSARPTSGESSHGLGLAIVKTLVDKLQGSIRLDSIPGKGSEFILLFPVKEAVTA
jgi:signal transduction histidine kinase